MTCSHTGLCRWQSSPQPSERAAWGAPKPRLAARRSSAQQSSRAATRSSDRGDFCHCHPCSPELCSMPAHSCWQPGGLSRACTASSGSHIRYRQTSHCLHANDSSELLGQCRRRITRRHGDRCGLTSRLPRIELGSCANPSAMCRYALGPWDMFKACAHREWILMRRHSFTYLFRCCFSLLPCALPTQHTRHTAKHAPADTRGLC